MDKLSIITDRIPVSEKSPCGCHVVTGAKILGILGVVQSLLGLIFLVTILFVVEEEEEEENEDPLMEQAEQEASLIPLWILVPLVLLQLFKSTCLTYGAFKNNAKMHLPYLYLYGIGLIFVVLSFLFNMGFVNFLVLLLTFAFESFFAWIVYCSYKFCLANAGGQPQEIPGAAPATYDEQP